jgi:hypothetical protein
MTAKDKGMPKYVRVAEAVRAQIADGTLRPGQPAPSGAALSRLTGFSTLTCRKALRVLIADGALIPGPSRNARPRVAGTPQLPEERDLAAAARALATGLAVTRRANGLTQPELARRVGVSVTTVGHAETGRLWQSRQFWERADALLGAGGELLALHDAYRAAAASSPRDATGSAAEADAGHSVPDDRPPAPGARAGARPAGLARGQVPGPRGPRVAPDSSYADGARGQAMPAYVMIMWSDGTVTTVHPPDASSSETSRRKRPD